jgi:hypothetical protein
MIMQVQMYLWTMLKHIVDIPKFLYCSVFMATKLFLSAEHTIYVVHISYCNCVSDLHRHESMEGQLDRMSNKDSPSSNDGLDLVLEKQREMIARLVIEDVFVLPSEFQAKSTSD